MITSFTIDRYRSIKHLELTGLRNINLLVGANNSGKSSVLEAVGLAVSEKKPKMMLDILRSREIDLNNIDLEAFFYMLDKDFSIQFKIENKDSSSYERYIIYKDDSKNNFEDRFNGDYLSMAYQSELEAATSGYSRYDQLVYSNAKPVNSKITDNNCILISNFTSHQLYNIVSELIEMQYEKYIINMLQQIDPRIKDIALAYKDVLVNIGTRRRLTINVMGDGIKRITTIIPSLIILPIEGILLVDEIDTGLHYSALTHLWKAVLATLKERPDLQLFANTHSDECVRALAYVLQQEYGEDLENAPACLIRIERQGEEHRAVYYEPDVLGATVMMNVEYR